MKTAMVPRHDKVMALIVETGLITQMVKNREAAVTYMVREGVPTPVICRVLAASGNRRGGMLLTY